MKVPFLDLITPHLELENQLVEAFRTALRSGRFVGGPDVEGLEGEFADYCGTSHCIAVNSGTDALRFALIACGIGKGDRVLTVPNTFIATTEAISQSGADFDFVDVEERTHTMDPNSLGEYLQKNPQGVKAVIPVHLYGQMADMDPILELAAQYDLLVIEDACQAHGAQYFSRLRNRWYRAGSMGKAAGFSFYPGKNLGACGEGGAVTTNDDAVATRVRMLRDHGQAAKYYHDIEGYNGRLDSVQCAVLRTKLRHLDGWNDLRRAAAARYFELLQGISELDLPYAPDWSRPVYHLYVVRTRERERLQNYLEKQHIGTGLHYPVPLHRQQCYASRKWNKNAFPVADAVASSILSLPMFPQLNLEQQGYIASQIQAFFETASSLSRPKQADSLPTAWPL